MSSSNGKKIKILYILDNFLDSNYIKCPAEFKGAECEMHMVTTKHEFLQAVEENKFDLVLCDPKLPEFDGIDILKYIRDNI